MAKSNIHLVSEAEASTEPIRTIYSLGGCVVHGTAKRIDSSIASGGQHFWRRPTIALMSKPVSHFRFDFSLVPADFANYLTNDACCAHLTELGKIPANSVLLFDITRDLFTGVLELEDGAFIMDPADAAGIIENVSPESLERHIVEKMLKYPVRRLSAQDQCNKEFITLWKSAIGKFIESMKAKKIELILAEIYFSSHQAGHQSGHFMPKEADSNNALLAEMYDYIKSNFDIKFASLPTDQFITGVHVEWGGPTHTHFINETYALLAYKVEDAASGQVREENTLLTKVALNRAHEHEMALQWVHNLKHEVAELTKKNEREIGDLQEKLITLRTENERLQARLEEVRIRSQQKEVAFLAAHAAIAEQQIPQPQITALQEQLAAIDATLQANTEEWRKTLIAHKPATARFVSRLRLPGRRASLD